MSVLKELTAVPKTVTTLLVAIHALATQATGLMLMDSPAMVCTQYNVIACLYCTAQHFINPSPFCF